MQNEHIIIVGNPLVELDRIQFRVAQQLKKTFPTLEFSYWDPTDELPTPVSKQLIIFDSVVGLTKTTVFKSLESFVLSPRSTVHDYDIPVELGLQKKLGKLHEFTIVGIPSDGDVQTIVTEIQAMFESNSI